MCEKTLAVFRYNADWLRSPLVNRIGLAGAWGELLGENATQLRRDGKTSRDGVVRSLT
jgi:hypothetical protein